MKLHVGIVLKSHMPYKHIVSVLDKSLGHITGIVNLDVLSVGSVICYYADVAKYHRYFLRELEPVSVPFRLACQDMLFLHHMLEICHNFLPEGVCADRIYALFCFVLRRNYIDRQQKIKFLCVLYVLLDLYIDDNSSYSLYAHELAQQPLDDMIDKCIDINIEKNISRWLYQCVSVHMQGHQCKTIHFLNELL